MPDVCCPLPWPPDHPGSFSVYPYLPLLPLLYPTVFLLSAQHPSCPVRWFDLSYFSSCPGLGAGYPRCRTKTNLHVNFTTGSSRFRSWGFSFSREAPTTSTSSSRGSQGVPRLSPMTRWYHVQWWARCHPSQNKPRRGCHQHTTIIAITTAGHRQATTGSLLGQC